MASRILHSGRTSPRGSAGDRAPRAPFDSPSRPPGPPGSLGAAASRPPRAATGLGPTSACSWRPARPRSKGAGRLPGSDLPGAQRPTVGPQRGDGGEEASRPHVAARAARHAHPLGRNPVSTWPDREPRGKRPHHGRRRPRVNYLRCSWCLKRFFSF